MQTHEDPLFILAPPCTFSWSVCAMLGQHPQLYSLPELHLFMFETMAGWLDHAARESYEMDHGLARAVAQLCFDAQTDETVARARGWLRRRAHLSTGLMFETLTSRLLGLMPVEKSPSIVYRSDFMKRAFEMFPSARFLHLLSHPRLYSESVMQALAESARLQPLSDSHWLMQLATFPRPEARDEGAPGILDPQWGWYALNTTITQFLTGVPAAQQMASRGEDVVAESPEALRRIVEWLGVRSTPDALAAMHHPERSAYAQRGPSDAPFGSDIFLLDGPLIRSSWLTPQSLDGPLSWREDDEGFLPEVKRLALEYGYQ